MKHFTRPWNWAGHVACVGDGRDAFRVVAERPGGKSPFGRHRQRWDDNFEMEFQEVKWRDMDWIELT
jgi:hypothetical protein